MEDFSNTGYYIKSPPLELFRRVTHKRKYRRGVLLATLQVHAVGHVHVQAPLTGGSVWEMGGRAGFRP